MNSSATMSGSSFCRQAATIALTLTGGRAFIVLDAGTGSLRENGGASGSTARLRASRTRFR